MKGLGTIVAAASATLVGGQAPAEMFAPVSVPSDHWVYPLLDRMAADGLLDGVWLPGRRPVDARAIGATLDSAVARAGARDAIRDGSPDGVSTGASRESPPEGGTSWRRTAVEARRWLGDEYGLPGRGTFRALPTGEIRAGDGPRTDPSALVFGSELRYRPTEDVGLWADPTVGLDSKGLDVPVPHLGGAWRVGSFRLAGSYAARRLGPGAGGGIVLHDEAELGWIELALAEPVILPWIFRYLGPFQVSGYGSRIGADSLGPSVALFAGEFVVQPHPRVTLGGYRSAVIVSEVDGERISVADVLKILFDSGRTVPNFEDQKLSFSGSVRTELLGLTVMPYFVWGIEDTWELERDPGAILGAWIPAIPTGFGPLGLRYEYTAFGDPGRIIWPWGESWEWRNWYRHSNGRRVFVDGDGELLGHPLGGYGTEHRVEASSPLPASGVLLRSALFTRRRDAGVHVDPGDRNTRPYSNLLYDEMPDRSYGGWVRAVYSTTRFRLNGELSVEIGETGWERLSGSVGGSVGMAARGGIRGAVRAGGGTG